MHNDRFSHDDEEKVDFVNPPESSPDGAENFSMEAQRHEFLGGGSSNPQSQERSSRRLKVFEVSRFDIKKPTVDGLENIPSNPCVIATTHLSDIDVQEVALAIADQRKIGIASQETNLTYAPFVPFVKAIGEENFFPISNNIVTKKYSKEEAEKMGLGKLGLETKDTNRTHVSYQVTQEDLDKLRVGIVNEGRTMILAAHNPTHNWQLPERPGIAAVVLAHMAHVPLVPAALDIESKKPVAQSTDIPTRIKNFVTLNRPSAKIIFGEPIQIAEISEDKLRAAVGLYSPDQRRNMSDEQVTEAKTTLSILQTEAEQMMNSLAEKLPPGKRGKWVLQNPPEQTPNPTS